MILESVAFYFFAGVCVASALAVIIARNPVRSVLFLILSFCSAAALFILLGAEFLGLILIVVYVGAVAVLFLFVVMMLDIDFAELRLGLLRHLPVGGLVGLVLLTELVLVLLISLAPGVTTPTAPAPPLDVTPNTNAIGEILYTDYFFFFQVAGVILLVAMIGAIVLTLRPSAQRKGLPPAEQIARSPSESVKTRDLISRRGI